MTCTLHRQQLSDSYLCDLDSNEAVGMNAGVEGTNDDCCQDLLDDFLCPTQQFPRGELGQVQDEFNRKSLEFQKCKKQYFPSIKKFLAISHS